MFIGIKRNNSKYSDIVFFYLKNKLKKTKFKYHIFDYEIYNYRVN